jgi:hypothetical protein
MAVLTYPGTMSLSHVAFPEMMSCVTNVRVAEAVEEEGDKCEPEQVMRFTNVPAAYKIVK